jgi:hypothetical protein
MAGHFDTPRGLRLVTFHRTQTQEIWPMAKEQFDESRLQALIKMEVACRLALESLPELPRETEEALREPIGTLCQVTERELERLRPGLVERPSETS